MSALTCKYTYDVGESELRHKLVITPSFTPCGAHQTDFITMKKYPGLYIQFVLAN